MRKRKALVTAVVALIVQALGTSCGPAGEPTLQQKVEVAAREQKKLADEWAHADALKDQNAKIKLAVRCLCTSPPNARSIYDSDLGKRTTEEARAFLLEHQTEARDPLLQVALTESDGFRFANACDLAARIGDREAVAPLLERLLALDGRNTWLEMAIPRFGDADLGPRLLDLYPYETPGLQDTIVELIGASGNHDVVPTLVAWCRSNGDGVPDGKMIWALSNLQDERAEAVFLDVLKEPRYHRNRVFDAIRGLVLLGRKIGDLPLPAQATQDLRVYTWSFAPGERPPVRHEGPNPALRKLIADRIGKLRDEFAREVMNHGLSLEIQAEPQAIVLGEKVKFVARIVNRAGTPAKVMLSRDGSDVDMVVPRITVEIRGPDHRPVMGSGIGRCGNVTALRPTDIVELAPGKTFDIFGPGSFANYKLEHFAPAAPGTYQIKMTYDTSAPARGAIGDSGAVPPGVATVKLVSKLIEVQVLPPNEK